MTIRVGYDPKLKDVRWPLDPCCPKCGNPRAGAGSCGGLDTPNEWKYDCLKCDIRFNGAGEVRPDDRRKL